VTQSLTPEILVYDFTIAGAPQIAPDGERIVHTLTQTDAETRKSTSHLWLCNVDGSDRRQLTQHGERNGGARWSPDGRSVAFVSSRGNLRGIYILSLNGGEAREITSHRHAISGLAWSPDGTQLAYATVFDPDNPDEAEPLEDAAPKVRVTRRARYKTDGRGYHGDIRTQLFVVDLATGERTRLTSGPRSYYAPAWSPDGTQLAAQTTDEDGDYTLLAIVEVATSGITYIGWETGTLAQWSWSPSGDRIVLAIEPDRTYQSDIYLYTTADNELRLVADDLDWDPVGGYAGDISAQPAWLDDQRVLFLAARAGGAGFYRVDLRSGEYELLYRSESTPDAFTIDASMSTVVFSYSSLKAQGEIAVLDMVRLSAHLITDHSSAVLEGRPPALWERLTIERAGYEIEGWLLTPPDFTPDKRYPLILDIHGGPNSFYGYSFSATHQLLATNGFIVVYANPRGSTSYGREFSTQVFGDWGGGDYEDLMATLDTVLERREVDSNRLGIRGYSYGGYMTAWTIGQTSRFKAAVCGAPCFDLVSMWGTSDIGRRFGRIHYGGKPHEIPDWYREHSPSTYAHRVTTPTLIIHGEADERCPINQGEQMFTALKEAGCEVEFARYPGGAHGFLSTGHLEHRVDALQRTLGWFKHHLGDPV
jgi:dipeptidyl aminopeptidase/acylaminoacyl peptidase